MEIPELRIEWAPTKKATEVPDPGDWETFSEREHETNNQAQLATIKRGRSSSDRGLSTGQAFIYCSDGDGALEPYDPVNNPTSNVKEGRQFRIFADFDGSSYPRFYGFLVTPDPKRPMKEFVREIELELSDVFHPLATQNVESEDFDEQVSGARVTALLTAANVPADRMAIDAGVSTLVGVELRGKPVLDELRQIAESTKGFIFASPEGKVTFLDRHRELHPDRGYFNVKATFGSDPTATTPPEFTGIGLDDIEVTGTYTGAPTTEYLVQVDGEGTPDTFRWSKDFGATWEASSVAITGGAQLLDQGVYVTFGATAGHTASDFWQFAAGEIPYAEIEPYISPVKNLIQARGGTGNLIEKGDATSQDEYDVKTETIRASLLANDNDVADFASYLLGENKDPHRQYNRVMFLPMVDDDINVACWHTILSLGEGDKVRVVERSDVLDSVTVSKCLVKGIEDKWSVSMWEWTSFFLSPALVNTYWILDDPVYSRLNYTTRPAF